MVLGVNGPFGLQSVNSMTSGGVTGQMMPYHMSGTYKQNIFSGDLVTIAPSISADSGYRAGDLILSILPKFNSGSKTWENASLNMGVFLGCNYNPGQHISSGRSLYWSTSLGIKSNSNPQAWVDSDPSIIFEVQVSSSVSLKDGDGQIVKPSLDLEHIGKNANLFIGSSEEEDPYNNPKTGSIITGYSGYYLDISSIKTDAKSTNLLPIKIIGLAPRINNEFKAPFNIALVTLNNHVLRAGTQGV